MVVTSMLSWSKRRCFNVILSSAARVSNDITIISSSRTGSKNIVPNRKHCFGSASKALVYQCRNLPLPLGQFSMNAKSRTADHDFSHSFSSSSSSSSWHYSLLPLVLKNRHATPCNGNLNGTGADSAIIYKGETISAADAAATDKGRPLMAFCRKPFLSAAAATGLIAWTTMLLKPSTDASLGAWWWKASTLLPVPRLRCSLESAIGTLSVDETTETDNGDAVWCLKRTFQPSIMRKKRKMGFLVRQRTVGGRRTLARRKAKGRARLGGGI